MYQIKIKTAWNLSRAVFKYLDKKFIFGVMEYGILKGNLQSTIIERKVISDVAPSVSSGILARFVVQA